MVNEFLWTGYAVDGEFVGNCYCGFTVAVGVGCSEEIGNTGVGTITMEDGGIFTIDYSSPQGFLIFLFLTFFFSCFFC